MLLKQLKEGDMFTLKEIECPIDKQVYIREEYCRDCKKYICGRADDISYSRLLKGTTVVYTNFTF